MLRRVADFVWPTLEPLDPSQASVEHHSLADDLEVVGKCNWGQGSALALEEARCLAEREVERRRNTEAKASTYLLVTAALVPIMTYLEGAVWEAKAGTAPTVASIPVLLFAVACLVNAGWWAFSVLAVSTSSVVDVMDLVAASQSSDLHLELTRLHLTVAKKSRGGINRKVSCLKMSHMFLLRSFAGFGVLLLVEAGWELWTALSLSVSTGPGGH